MRWRLAASQRPCGARYDDRPKWWCPAVWEDGAGTFVPKRPAVLTFRSQERFGIFRKVSLPSAFFGGAGVQWISVGGS